MGYATVMNVPRINTYAEALKRFDNTKPIKGREDNKRPLGNRRDVDTYSIRKNVWTDAIELVLYQTPVIKFTVAGEVVINIDTWPSASTCQFIDRILYSVRANRVRGDVVLHFVDGHKTRLAKKEELVLVQDEHGRWQPKERKPMFDWRVSRKGANEVRKTVSQFKDYLAGVVKLKAEEIVHNEGSYYERRYNRVKTNYEELMNVFGKQDNGYGNFRPNVSKWEVLTKKPHAEWQHTEAMWQDYRETTEKFFDLIKNDQDDNVRHQNYWIAYNILLVQNKTLYWRDNVEMEVSTEVDEFEPTLDKILFMMFSDKVFKKVELGLGKVPTGKYDKYVLTEE